MGYRITRIRALVVVDPEAARKELLAAFQEAKASRRDAAKLLGCDEDTFARWADMLGARAELDVIEERAKEQGWHHGRNRMGGRPKGTGKRDRRRAVAR